MPHRVIVLMKGSVEALPPILTLCLALTSIGRATMLVTSSAEPETIDTLRARGVEVRCLGGDQTSSGRRGKLMHWLAFRRRAQAIIRAEACNGDLLWFGSADAALAFGSHATALPFVLQLHELYDEHPLYLKALRAFAARASAIVVPEPNRAAILRSWLRLPSNPFVLPNKPEFHPRERGLPLDGEGDAELLGQLEDGARVVLYQGVIHPWREIAALISAVNGLGWPWKSVVMGRADQGYLSKLRESGSFLFVPYRAPPSHLCVTSRAFVGALTYSYDVLNNLFCAPNKLWEYAGFGIPMIGNDVPGLRAPLERFRAGECVDFGSVDSIKAALLQIEQNYEEYADGSSTLFESFDYKGELKRILAAVKRGAPHEGQRT